MKDKETLAMISIPCQTWGTIYDGKEALKRGTMFKELEFPFFAAEKEEAKQFDTKGMKEEVQMMRLIQENGFLIDDLNLYLDMHPEDKEANTMMKELIRKQKQLEEDFAERYYPINYISTDGIIGPNPWEGVCM